jgi:hypothetical protein
MDTDTRWITTGDPSCAGAEIVGMNKTSDKFSDLRYQIPGPGGPDRKRQYINILILLLGLTLQ